MTDQETIAAIAAELTRLGKNPDYGDCASPEGLCPISDKLTLAALSGVAAEVIATDGVTIRVSFGEWCLRDEMLGSLGREPTYHEALVAALKQVESEVKK